MGLLLSRLGPGMMLAAVAVGVSHLVFSTQAGANYGLSLAWLIILVVILKYPAFHFSVQYASATGRSLVTGYSKIGKVALMWLVVGFFVDTFIATGAVAMVTAGLFISVFNLPFSGPQVAVALMVASAAILMNGQYARAERLVKIFVLAFSVLAVIATLFALPLIGDGGRAVFAELTPSRSLAVFVIAIAGWMPMPLNGSVQISKWVVEKRHSSNEAFDHRQALSDFRIGYGLTLLLALCFLLMGTAVLFDAAYVAPANPGAFASELLGIFTTVIGKWSYPVIAVAALAVMWSTQIALMDVMPRLTDRLLGILTGRADDAPSRYSKFLIVQVVGVSIILLFLMKGFTGFLYFATSMGFVAAPAIAYYNYLAITSDDVPQEFRPGRHIIIWNWISVFVMAAFALAFLYISLT
ncbi:MAG: divalent metal cation transporter [Gammaproteobacteria bacterium]|nr:divalent metal cation transporter [Gammaproteobacteria bacterium]